MNVGLMGGTFNPVHFGHLRIAEEAREGLFLDRVIFIPSADPPHKPLAGDVPYRLRHEMVRTAIAGNRAFELSDVEARRQGKSYSIDTISYFRASFPHDVLYFIIGSDSFCEIGTWHRYAEIFSSCNLIVAVRPGCHPVDPLDALPVAIRGEFVYTPENGTLQHDSGCLVHFIKGCPLDISSTEIRRLVAAGRSISYLVPPAVEAYITEQRIYHP